MKSHLIEFLNCFFAGGDAPLQTFHAAGETSQQAGVS